MTAAVPGNVMDKLIAQHPGGPARRAQRGRPGGGVPRRPRVVLHHRPGLPGQRRPVHVAGLARARRPGAGPVRPGRGPVQAVARPSAQTRYRACAHSPHRPHSLPGHGQDSVAWRPTGSIGAASATEREPTSAAARRLSDRGARELTVRSAAARAPGATAVPAASAVARGRVTTITKDLVRNECQPSRSGRRAFGAELDDRGGSVACDSTKPRSVGSATTTPPRLRARRRSAYG